MVKNTLVGEVTIKKSSIKYIIGISLSICCLVSSLWILNNVFKIMLVGSILISVFVSIDIGYVIVNYWGKIKIAIIATWQLIKYFYKQYYELLKFALVGGTGAIINYSLLYVLTEKVGIYYLASATISAFITTIFNFTINHIWTFHRPRIKDNWFVGWLRYKLIDDISILVYLGQLTLYTEVFSIWYIISAIIATIINYPIRYFILKRYIWEIRKYNQKSSSYEWDSYYNGNVLQMWWKRKIANTIWEWIPDTGKLLDVGCGSSPIIGKYTKAIGIDINIDKIKFMREKYPLNHFAPLNINHFKDGKFDCVICVEVIEHMENPIEMIAEISRVLKNGGKAVIATPDYSKLLWKFAERFTPYKEEHHNQFTANKLDNICERFNLYPIRYRYVAGCDLIVMFTKREY